MGIKVSNLFQNVRMSWSKLLLVLVIAVDLACSVKPDDLSRDNSIDDILRLAEKASKRKAFNEAGDFYMEVDRFYPYSDKSREALVKAMKAYHDGSDLSKARLSAKRYLTVYPKGPNAAFAQYMVGLSFFDSIVDVRRDQGATFHAVKEFKKLKQDHPESPYIKLADDKLNIAYSQVAGQEMSVGRYYLKRDEYLAAINRFNIVIEEYSGTIFSPEAFYRLTEAYLALGMHSLAIENNKTLLKMFPLSEWSSKSNILVERFTL